MDERVLVTATTQIKIMKDLARANLPRRSKELTAVPRTQTKSPSVFIEPGDAHGGGVGVSVDIKIGEKREALNMIIQGKGTPATSSSSPTLTLELISVS